MRKIIPLIVLVLFWAVFAKAQNVNQADANLALQLVDANKAAIGISDDLLHNSKVFYTYEDKTTGIRYVSLQQQYKSIPVHNQILALSFRNGKLLSNFGSFDPSIEKTVNIASATPSVNAESAVQSALSDRGFHASQMAIAINRKDQGRFVEFGNMGISRENITAQLSWIPDETTKTYSLAWKVYIIPKTTSDYWMIRVNAENNSILGMDNYTDYDNWGTPNQSSDIRYPGFDYGTASLNSNEDNNSLKNVFDFKKSHDPSLVTTASYRVVPIPAESPLHPGGAPALRTDPWTNAGVVANAVTLKWHTGAAAADYDYTRSNNVWAYEDRTAPANTGSIAKSASSQTAFPNLTFDFVPDFTQEPTVNTVAVPNQRFNITNLFYWNNLIHDIFYGYGFTEAGKNFQDDNLGRGGAGNDHVNAEAQDASGTNNANFSTPADGSSGRMQMYLWTAPTPDRDGDVDNGIIIHEYGHGISNRSNPGGTGCLGNSEQAGEGWSDYLGLMLTQNWATSVPGDGFNSPRGIGTYALNQPNNGPGIRPARYCTDFAVNNYTYSNIGAMAVPHGVGFVFCTALWEMTWELINDPSTTGIEPNIYNFAGTGGNVVALRLVMEGLRTQQCNPGFISARNAIMRADTTLYGGSHACAILRAFARRGMGLGAAEGSTSNNNDQTVSFNGGGPAMAFTQNGQAGVPELQNIVYNHAITANCSAISNYTLRDTLPLNVNFVSATNGGTYSGPPNRVVSWPVNIAVGATQNYGLTVQVAAGSYFPPVSIINEPVPSTTISGFWTTTSAPAGNPWIAHNVRSHSAPNSFFTPDIASASDQIIATTNNFAIGATAPVLSFWHWYNSEASWDGGVLEISTNGGTTWSDIGAANFTQNGYNGALNTGSTNPLTGRQAWNGNSGAFVETKVNMNAYANQPTVKLRWRFGSDGSVGATGWNVDDILMETRAVVNLRSSLFNASNVRVTFNDTVTVILPATTANPTVTINQAAAQADPTSASPINFTAVFSEAVTGFATGDVTLSGTAGATTAVVSGGPITYNVAVSGMTGSGTVIATIAAGVCQNGSAQPNNASTSTDNTVTYNAPAACTSVNPVPSDTVCNGATHAAVTFSSPTPGTTFSWVNNTPSIGLAASGTGNLPVFVAANATTLPVIATITVTPTLTTVTPTTTTFNFSGGAQTFTVPAGVTSINFTALGAEGGSGAVGGNGSAGGAGGKGSRATGTLAVTPGQVLNIFVGGAGGTPTAGFNGGGAGGNANSGGGGGASDVRFPGATTADRILTAAGGGGGGRGGCETGSAITGGTGGNGDGNGVNGTNSPNGGGGFGAIGTTPGGAGIGCAGFLGAPGLANTGATGGDGGAGQTCCCFSFASVPGGGGGGGGQLGGAGGGGGSAGTVGCAGNDKGGGGGGAGGTSYTGGVTAGAITTNIQSGNGQVVLNYNVTTICNGPTMAFTITVNPTATVNAVPNQVVCQNAPTAPINFTSPTPGVIFNWTNNTPAIGLAASGTGNIASFTALNPGTTPLVATVTVTPLIPLGGTIPGGPVTFTNTANIAIPGSGTGSTAGSAANPYPSTITVSGVPTTGVTVQSVTLTNIQHTWSDDIGVLLVGPGGQKFVPMARVGGSGGFDATATVTLRDGNPAMPTGTAAIPSGTYAPTAGTTAIWPAPAPATPYNYPAPQGTATFANTFNNTSNYNGTWSLYVTDMAGGDVGNIAGGWGITVVTPAVPAVGCAGTPRTFTITVNPNANLIIVADPGTTLCEGDPTLLTVYDAGAVSAPGTLYTQGTTPVNGSPSQVFEPANVAFNSQAADDFVVPAGGNWGVTGITANGIGTGAPTSVNVFFYTNSGTNLPGTTIASFTNLTTFTRVGGNYTVTLPSSVALTAGRYWMSFQVNMSFAAGGQWFWGNYGAPIVGNQYAWQNPGGGFATPCTSWGYGGTGCNVGGGAANVNNIFSIVGTNTGLGPQSTGTFLWSPAAGLSSTTSNPVAASPQNTTTYTVTRTTVPGGCQASAQVTITVNKRPVVTTQPVSRVNCSGTTATFTVGGTGTGLTYQWQMNTAGCTGGTWVNVPTLPPYAGGTTPTLTITPVDGTMSGYGFRCVLSGICAPWTPPTNVSNCATLTVNPLPNLVVTPPVSCGGVAGISGTALTVTQLPPPVPGTVTVNSGAIAVAIPDGSNVAATTNLTVAGIPAAATITDAKVNVNISHTWVGDVDLNLRAPNNAILNLVAGLNGGTGGNAGDNFTNTTFSSLSSAVISGAPDPRTGTFAAEARAGRGPIGFIQTVATWGALYPTATAANGVWTLAAGDRVLTDVGTITNWSITINYTTPGSGPLPTLSYVWTPNTTVAAGLYTNNTATTLYTGTNLSTVYAAPPAQTTYTVTATNTATGCVGTATALVNYTPPAPTVTPSSVTMCLGDPAVKLKSSSSTTSTVAFNSGTIAVAIPDNNQAGASHTIAVSGIPANATVTGMRVKMTIPHTFIGDLVIALRAPNNNVLNLDFFLSNTFGGVTTGFSNTIFTSAPGAPAVSSGTNPYSASFRADGQIAATGNGPAAPTGYTANMASYAALIGSLTPANVNGNYTLAMYDGGAIDIGTLTNWEIEFTYVVGVPASPAVWSPAAGLFSDALATVPYVAGTAVDSVWARPTPQGVYPYQVTVNNLITTLATPTTPMAGGNGNNLVTFNVKNNNTYPVTLSSISSNTFGSGAVTSTVFYKTTGNAGNPGPISAANGFVQFGSAASTVTAGAMNQLVSGLNLQIPAGATYAIAIDMTGATFPAYTNGAATTVTYSDAGCDIITGGNVGWGGPNAPAAPVNNPRNFNGSITFLGSGPGSCTSPPRTVVVTVNQPTTLNSNLPANQTVCTDKVATFSVAVTAGTGPHSYQWQVSTNSGNPPWTNVTNTGVYSGATTATLTITAPPVSMSGYQYRCIVTGAAPCAAATSKNAILTVNPLPVIVISAAPYTSLFPGLRTTLSSTVSPNAASTYSWIRNGVVLASPAQGVLSGLGTGTIQVDVDGMGDYQLRVTDVNGCTNTSNTLTIKDSASGRCFIYPNPNSGQFQVRYYSVANNVLPRGIVVYNALGDRVKVQNYTIGRPYDRMDVDMRANGKGLYWVEVVDRNGNRLTMCRVVIE